TWVWQQVSARRHKVPLTLYLFIYVGLLHCQQFIIPFKAPSDCRAEQFFDISSLSCVSCGPNQRRRLSCVCQTGYQTLTTDKASITCQQCPINKPAVTKDGFGCIRCPGALSDDGKCKCPPDSFLVERDINGNLLDEAKCETCNGDSPASTVPSSSGDRCERCQASFIDTSCECNSPNILVSSDVSLPSHPFLIITLLTNTSHLISDLFLIIQAGGLCFRPGGLSTNMNPSVNYAQLVGLLLSRF
uniref:Uncharacterized protein n=1 Tax=Acanthochromis polyacanthus TaxID=80966 RepID=A0A3Q1ES77_9TELE